MSFDNDLSPAFAAAVEEAQRETACMMAFWDQEQVEAFTQGTKVVGATSDELEHLAYQAMAAGNLPRSIGLAINAQTVECIEDEAARLEAGELPQESGHHPIDRPAFGRKKHD